MPHIPTSPVAPRLGGEPLDRVEAVARLVRGVLVEGDAADEPVPADVDPAQRVAARREPLAARRVGVAPPVVLAVRDHLEDRREARGPAPSAGRAPDVGRQLDAVAGRDPDVPLDRDGVAGGLAGRAARRRRVVIGASLGRPAPRPRRPPRATMRRWTSRSRRSRSIRSVDAPLAPGRLREPVDHGLARRGRSGPTAAPGSTASSISRTWRPAWSPSMTRTGSCWSGSTATRSTRTRGRSPRAACPTARPARRARSASSARRPASRPPTWRELARVDLSNSVSDEVAFLYLAHGPRATATAIARADRGARGPLGAVRRGARDDARRPHHRRDERARDPARRAAPTGGRRNGRPRRVRLPSA